MSPLVQFADVMPLAATSLGCLTYSPPPPVVHSGDLLSGRERERGREKRASWFHLPLPSSERQDVDAAPGLSPSVKPRPEDFMRTRSQSGRLKDYQEQNDSCAAESDPRLTRGTCELRLRY